MKYPWSFDCSFLGPCALGTDLDRAHNLIRSSFVKGGAAISGSLTPSLKRLSRAPETPWHDNHSLIFDIRTQSKAHLNRYRREMSTTTYTAASVKSRSWWLMTIKLAKRQLRRRNRAATRSDVNYNALTGGKGGVTIHLKNINIQGVLLETTKLKPLSSNPGKQQEANHGS